MRAYVTILILSVATVRAQAENPPTLVLPRSTVAVPVTASPPAAPPAGGSPTAPPMPDLREPLAFKDLTPPEQHHKDEAPHLDTAHEHPPENLFFSGEYLLLRARRAAFDFAISDSNRDLVPSGSIQSLNYNLQSGVRAGVGYRFGESAWVGDITYTYFRSGADRDVTAPAGGTLYATLTRPGLNDEAVTATANGSLEYNVFDATVGRWITIDEHAAMRLYGGFRWATVRDKFSAVYNGGDANLGQVSTQNKFDGFGPILGGELVGNISGGFHLFARGNASLLTGSFNNPIRETNNAGLTTYADLQYGTRRVIPVVGLGVGGGWAYRNVTLRAGYEITNWFGMIDSPRLSGELSEAKYTTRSGNLSLEGLFFQLGLAW
ncbi:hypothetical protein BH11PLA2_BH11PLA2_14330 [soil metagenome]